MTKLNEDCLILIFNNLQDSLYSCLFVNKDWCNVVIPILWKNYSWYINDNELEKKLFTTILCCLSSSSKQLLSDNNIILPSTILLNIPLFNYISFCKFPKIEITNKIIKMVLENNFNNFEKRNLLEQEIYKLFVSQCKDIKELQWKTLQPLSLFPGALTCFSQLHSLNIDIYPLNSNVLYEMSQICKNLNSLSIQNFSKDSPGLISLIDTQRNLKKVYLYDIIKKGNCKELNKALARKANTINYLYLANKIFKQTPLFLESLVNLKWLTIFNINSYSERYNGNVKELLAISEFPHLEHLRISHLSCFKEISLLIEKTKGKILDIYIYISKLDNFIENTGMLIKSISNNCPKIKLLYTYISQNDFFHVKSLLLNCRYLEEIRLGSIYSSYTEFIGDELLDILTKFSSKSLTKVTIGKWRCSIDALKRFFESYRGRTLSYFEIPYHYQSFISKYINEGVIVETFKF
ncbi:hypothetical protein C1645_875321 [Glomus cerebriforme]|uniref:F-box domain-containing protein n=1 Tax=Glomus cerebriforme TaxID=658196 RepID=A0A397SZF3_9GLOM|nr:hypothetical protein C1645_875321 [Glomus cerebriforme]